MYSNVYSLHFLHTKFYLICDVGASKWVSRPQTFSPATSCGWIGTRVSLIWQALPVPLQSLYVSSNKKASFLDARLSFFLGPKSIFGVVGQLHTISLNFERVSSTIFI